MIKSLSLVADIKMRWFANLVLMALYIVGGGAHGWAVKRLFSIKVRCDERDC